MTRRTTCVQVVLLGLAASCAAQSFPTNGAVPFADDFQPQDTYQPQQFQQQDDGQYQRLALRTQQDFLRTVDEANHPQGQKVRRPQPPQFGEQGELQVPVQRPRPLGSQPRSQPQFQQPIRQQQQQSFQQPLRTQPQPTQGFNQPQQQSQSFKQLRTQQQPQQQPQPQFQPLRSQPQPQPQPLQEQPLRTQPQQPQLPLRQRQPLRQQGQLQQQRAQPRPQFQPPRPQAEAQFLPASAPPPPPHPPPPPPAPEPVTQQFFDEPRQVFQPQTFDPEPAPAPVPAPTPAPRRPALEPLAVPRPQPRQPPKSQSQNQENVFDEELFKQQAENAKYSFSASLNDGISDNQQVREEARDGLNLKGLYSYSDGYYKRTVHYEADENGYRVTKEDVEPLGDGPQEDPNGRAEVTSNVGGASLQYTVTAADIPTRPHAGQPIAQPF